MFPCQKIDLSDWQEVCTEFWNIEVRANTLGRREVRVYKERNPIQNHQRKERVVVHIHQKDFGGEAPVTVRSVHFFNSGPYIQLWRDYDHPCNEDFDLNPLQTQTSWWQNKLYRAVNLDGNWYRLEISEAIVFGKFIVRREEEVIGVFLRIVDADSPSNLIKEALIN